MSTRKRKEKASSAQAAGVASAVGPGLTDLGALLALAALAAAAFAGPLLASGGGAVLSAPDGDLATQFIHWRQFGFGELARGNLALWNPRVFCGVPFLGGFQAALLYPPNALFLVLPLGLALGLSIALHVFATGAAMIAWARFRGMGSLAAFLAGAVLMFCGPVFPHVYPGHLSNLCAMPWVPLLLLCIDAVMQGRGPLWALAGAAVTALLVLAGHPQYVFHAAVAAGLMAALLLPGAPRPRASWAGMATVAAGGAALAAVQLLTGISEAGETVRAGGLWYDYAAMFSLPPENLLTALSPDFFGHIEDGSYWGRCLLWEMSLYFGVTTLSLAAYGAVHGERRHRALAVPAAAALLVLALGSHTPLFRILFELVPGFASFRGHSKFTYPMAAFVALLAGAGLQRLLDAGRPPRRWLAGALALACFIGLAGASLGLAGTEPASGGLWPEFMKTLHAWGAPSNEAAQPAASYDSASFVDLALRRARRGLLQAAILLAASVLAMSALDRTRLGLGALVLVTLLELGTFVVALRPTFFPGDAATGRVTRALRADPGDYRILFLESGNAAMSMDARDLWGHDPGTPLRHAQLLAFTQGLSPEQASQYLEFRHGHPLHALLRLKYVFRPDGKLLWTFPRPLLPRAWLVGDCVLAPNRDAALAALAAPDFDPATQVVLESIPHPTPATGPADGKVRIVEETTDNLTIEAETSGPSVLVVAEGYFSGWRARALAGSCQQSYEVVPADFALRGVPLQAGRHRLRLEYSPGAFRVGVAITVVAILLWLGTVGWGMKRQSTPVL